MKSKFLVVGAGYAGAVCARMLAQAGFTVHVIDKRDHIAGNAYDFYDEHGVLVHKYGPHIFHTNSKPVFEFLSQFTDWHFYEHRVLAHVNGHLYPIPINQTTINRLYNLDLDEAGVSAYLEKVRVPKDCILTSEDVVLNSVGVDLCEKFFRGYTRKQWGLDLSELAAGVASRIPTRTNNDDRYFTDTYQFMPLKGYTEMFRNILNHPHIQVDLGVDFHSLPISEIQGQRIIYTGPIDAYYDYKFGKLPYRSLTFKHVHHANMDRFQPTAQVNYPDMNDGDFTRITEYKHFGSSACQGTSIAYEFSCADGDPYYPIPRQVNQELYQKYAQIAQHQDDVYFVGRLAQYKYYNMDQVIANALKVSNEIIKACT